MQFLSRHPDRGLGNISSSPGDPSRNVDWILFAIHALLVLIGVAVVYSASRPVDLSDPYRHATRQVVFAVVAGVVMVVVMSVDYEWFAEKMMLFYGGTVALLVLLLIMGTISSRDRITFDLGPINFQPAEFAKFSVLVALASYLAAARSDEITYARFLGGLIMIGVPTVLIVLQPDLGSASVIIMLAMGVLLVAGAKLRHIAVVTSLALVTVVAAFFTGLVSDYQTERLRVFFGLEESTDSGFQVRNAIRAVGTGGLWGKGWLQGDLTNRRYVPVMWADFPFAALGEQFGLIGGVVLLSLFVIALVRIWRIATLSRDLFGTLLCAGVFSMLLWQVFQNIGMTLGVMPVTGLPLPFISYGGSGLVVYSALFGLVQSVHMRRMR